MLYFTIWPMVLGVVFMVIIPLCASGAIKANRFVGIRWPALRASEAAWERGHQAALPATFIGGILTIVVGTVLAFIPGVGVVAPLATFAVLLIGFGVASRMALRAAAE